MPSRTTTHVSTPRSETVTPIPHNTTNQTPFTFTETPFTEFFAEISDETGKRREISRDKYCSHYKKSVYSGTGPLHFASKSGTQWWEWTTKVATYGWDNSYFGPYTDPFTGINVIAQDDGFNGKFVLPAPNHLELQEGSIRALLPRIRPGLSSLNDLIETKDFKSLPVTLKKIVKFIYFAKRFNSLIKGKGIKAGKRTISDLLREVRKVAPDAFLQWKFNISPTYTDVAAAVTAANDFGKRVEKILAEEGQLKVVHYMKYLDDKYPNSDEYTVDNSMQYLYGARRFRRQVQYTSRPVFRAHMRYSYKFTKYQRRHAFALGLLDSIGAGGVRPSVIWNAIPWSFVVDWTIGISNWLKSNLDAGAFDPVTSIQSYTYSYSLVRKITSYTNLCRADSPFAPGSDVVASVVCENGYLRVPVRHIDITSSLTLSGISFNEFILSAALGLSRK